MEIKRFDATEFKAIQCGKSGGYYRQGSVEAKRALLLMDEGIYKVNPVENWSVSGWKFTELGEEYYSAFMAQVQNKHGHVWMTNNDCDPDFAEDSEYGKSVNIFAYSAGYHNGPECKNCGYSFCHHCDSEFDVPECTNQNKGE